MSKQNQIVVTLKSFNDFGKDIKVTFDFQLPGNVKNEFSFCWVKTNENFSLNKQIANALLLSLSEIALDLVKPAQFDGWIQRKNYMYMIKSVFNLKIINAVSEINYRQLNDALCNLIMPAGEFKLVQAAA